MSNDIFHALEVCLKEMERGADIETVLARYPDMAAELRPILETAVMAQYAAAADPSPDVVRRGRARVMQHAAEMREGTARPRRSRPPLLQRLTLVFSLAALILAVSGAGLLNASASSLPGESLYPVKRSWENVRLLFVLDPNNRSLLESQFYYERLSEVTRLLSIGREEPVQFAGMYTEIDGQIYVSGVQVMINDATILPTEPLTNGSAVLVEGMTNALGWVDATVITLLPQTVIVPAGEPAPAPVPTSTPIPTAVPTRVIVTNTAAPTATPQTVNGNTNQSSPQNSNDNSNNDDDNDNDSNDNDDD